MAKSLPKRPSLSSLRKQAKSLLRDARNGDEDARARIARHHPKAGERLLLRDAQLAIAREYGLPGWRELLGAVESAELAALSREERANRFIDLACLRYREPDAPVFRQRARKILDAEPEIAQATLYAAATAGDAGAVQRFLERDPACANAPGGPRQWTALAYLCYARLPGRPGDPVPAARALLDAGADPNTVVPIYDEYHYTALTGAMGEGEAGLVNQPPHPNARELADLLLDFGANPNEGQGLYQTHFTPGNEWIELLLARGLTADAPTNWFDPEGMRMLDYLLGVAVTFGFADRVQLLLAHGADPNGRDAYDDRLHYENALLYGQPEIAQRLVDHGANPVELSPAAAFRAACFAVDETRARSLLGHDPSLIDDDRLIHDAIRHGGSTCVRLLFELGGSLLAKGQHYGETPLHQAAISGRRDVVDLLLERGARIDLRDPEFDGSPVGWAHQGGHAAIRDHLLDLTEDVHDLTAFERVNQLRTVLRQDPARARATRSNDITPLHAVGASDEERAQEAVDLLLAAGADLHARTSDGKTPLAVALEADDDALADLLRERGATEA